MGASTLTKRQSFDLSVRQVVREYNVVADTLDVVIDENISLREENARLLSCLHDDGENAAAILNECERLRSLASDLWRNVNKAYVEGRPLAPYEYDERVKELGIDVG